METGLPASSINPSQAVSPLVNFEGLKNSQNKLLTGDNWVPPDTEGDVGPNHYVQSVNDIFAVYSKSGTLLAGPFREDALFASVSDPFCGHPADEGGDPIVKYDALADRWLFTYLSYPSYPSPPFYLCTAVSQSGDPTGAWWLYVWQYDTFGTTAEFPDYPKYSVWPDGYYLTVNQFNVTNNPSTVCNIGGDGCYDGVGVVVFDRASMLTGATASAQYFDVPPGQGSSYGCEFSFMPSDLNGHTQPPVGTNNTLAEVYFPAVACGFDGLKLWDLYVNWAIPSNSVLRTTANLVTNPFNPDLYNFPGIPEPSPASAADYLDPLSDRLMYRLQYRDFGSYQSILATHTVDVNGNNHAGVRWYELRNTGTNDKDWFIYQQGDYAPDSDNRWIASVAQDSSGNIALCYSVSSTVTFPSIRCTAHLAGDPLGQMTQPEVVIMAGKGSQLGSSNRWGDYSALQIDPSDDGTFWYTNEYYPSSGTFVTPGWSTRIASFTFRSIVTFGIGLVAGWNLISFPLVPSNTKTTVILAPLISSKNLVSVYTYNTKTATWSFFLPPGSGTLLNMYDGKGYWIFIKFAATVQVTGYIIPPASSPPTYSLFTGWNLVGFKPQPTIVASEQLSQYLNGLGSTYDKNNIWIYDNPSTSWTRAANPLTGADVIKPGQAFWILMTAPATLTP